MYGSDWPVCLLAKGVQYGDVLKLLQDLLQNLSHQEKKAIFQDNAIRFYNLDDVVHLE